MLSKHRAFAWLDQLSNRNGVDESLLCSADSIAALGMPHLTIHYLGPCIPFAAAALLVAMLVTHQLLTGIITALLRACSRHGMPKAMFAMASCSVAV
jgi:hypothetical protein